MLHTEPSTSATARTSRWLRSFGGVLVLFTVAFYVPLTITYFWNGPYEHRLQDDALALLTSPAFAFGAGSGYADGHFVTYAQTYASMWTHVFVGSLTMTAGLAQFSTRLRRGWTALHRFTGRVFLVGCLLVATTAVSYLVQTPDENVFSGKAFAEVLYLLALGTGIAAVLALVSIRRRDVVAHREYVALAFALIMSAALLRVGWIAFAQVWDAPKETINLTEGAWAGPFLFTCAIAYARRYGGGARRAASPLASAGWLRITGLGAVLGTPALLAAAYFTDWADADWWVPGPVPLVVFWVVPFAAQTLAFAVLERRASSRGDNAARTAWRSYLTGNLAAPAVSVVVLAYAVWVHAMPLTEAWWAAPLGWSLAQFFTMITHTALTTSFAQRAHRSAPEPQVAQASS